MYLCQTELFEIELFICIKMNWPSAEVWLVYSTAPANKAEGWVYCPISNRTEVVFFKLSHARFASILNWPFVTFWPQGGEDRIKNFSLGFFFHIPFFCFNSVHSVNFLFLTFTVNYSYALLVGVRINCYTPSSPQKWCTRYETKLHLVVRLQFWRFMEYGVSLLCNFP